MRYQRILEAQKKIVEKKGSKDIEWRAATNDIMAEFRLLRDYKVWSYKALNNADIKDSEKEVDFFAQLCEDLTRDMHEVDAHLWKY